LRTKILCLKDYTIYYYLMKSNLFISSVFCLFLFTSTQAQNNTSSPYSIRAYGEVEDFNTAFTRALAGASNGIRNERSYSFSNPASLGYLKKTVMDFGMRADYTKLQGDSGIKTSNNGNFNYFSLAFPVFRKSILIEDSSNVDAETQKLKIYTEYKNIWNMAFGFSPYSSINVTYTKLFDTSYGKIGNYYSRTGGLSRFLLSNAVNLTPNLSLGLNTSYIFGQSRAFDAYYLFDTGNTRATISDNNIKMKGFKFDLGIQGENQFKLNYSSTVKSDSITKKVQKQMPVRLVYGVTFSNETSLKYNVFRQILNKSNYYTNGEIDTVLNEENKTGKTNLPLSFSAGLSITFNNKWMICGDYRMEKWSSLKNNYFSDVFTDSRQINIGFAYRPDINVEYMNAGKANFEYRLGFRNLVSGYNFLDNQGNISALNEYGINFGIGIPKLYLDYSEGKRVSTKSMINITGEYVMRGNTKNGMIKENLYRLTIGFTLSDIWFKQRKFQ
jgi:long-subunit fatty acid transport protein